MEEEGKPASHVADVAASEGESCLRVSNSRKGENKRERSRQGNEQNWLEQ
jgi:hypothetical protein